MARVLTPTGLFEYLAGIALGLVRNDGRRLMMAVVTIAAPICAVLPNAAVVILVAPLIISICRQMELDFVQPVILLVFVANSAGLLTPVGDPTTFLPKTGCWPKSIKTRDRWLIGIGGHLAMPPLPHHRAYGSVPRRFDWVKLGRRRGVGEYRVSRSSDCAGPVGPPGVRTCARTPSANRRRPLP
jgi:Citrate transporter